MAQIEWTAFKNFVVSRKTGISYTENTRYYFLKSYDGPEVVECWLDKDPSDTTDLLDFETNFKATSNQKVLNTVEILKSPPFADPLYRTRHSRLDGVQVCQNGGTKVADYVLSEELYCSGGTLLVKNAQMGDWVEAMVYDALGVIPEAMRSDPAVAEAWPIVSTYIVGQYLELNNSTSIWHKQGVDTRPLVAKVPAGLSLRVVYHALNELGGAAREFYINYFLHKKL